MSFSGSELFNRAIINEQVNITPIDLNKNMNDIIIRKLKNKLEGYCTQFGYIEEVICITEIEDNPKINDNGDGDCVVKVKVEVKRCMPEKGQLIECKITADDEHMGVFISYQEPIFISIINSTKDELFKNDIIIVCIEDFQLKHRDSIINITSSYVNKKKLI